MEETDMQLTIDAITRLGELSIRTAARLHVLDRLPEDDKLNMGKIILLLYATELSTVMSVVLEDDVDIVVRLTQTTAVMTREIRNIL